MPTSHGKHDPSEAREVDRLLRQLNPDGLARPPLARPGPGPGPAVQGRPRSVSPASRTPTPLATWARVLLGAVLAGAMTQWPYATCGLELAAYLFAAVVVLGMGIWGSRSAWKARLGWAHLLGIATMFAGAGLAAFQLLPRLGYAGLWVPWGCVG